MKIIISILFVGLSLISLNCSKESVSPTEGYSISGKVLSKGEPVEGAIISINTSPNLKTQSDSQGDFKILNVPKGNHSLTVSKDLAKGAFTERTTLVTVEKNVTIGNLILPVGVQLFEPESVTDVSLLLKWSPTDASDFREYKIYQHKIPPGLTNQPEH